MSHPGAWSLRRQGVPKRFCWNQGRGLWPLPVQPPGKSLI